MIEHSILSGLIERDDYTRSVFPFIKADYFEMSSERTLFECYDDFFNTYNKAPSKEALKLKIDNRTDLNETSYKESLELLDSLKSDPNTDVEFLVQETEKFCQDRAVYNAVRHSIGILDGKDKKLDKGSIPKLLEDALGVSFSVDLGHDYLEDFKERYKYLHAKEDRIKLDIDILNRVTNGGLAKGSLTCLLSVTGGGKSLVMGHLASQCMVSGYNVLYISLELNKFEVSKRIDANLLDVVMNDLSELPVTTVEKRLARIKDNSPGKLIIEQFPTGSAHVGHFRHLLNELRMKKKFRPDIIFIDYLNICTSSRMKMSENSYGFIKSISEELRGLAMELNLPIVTASQLNRQAYGSSDVDMTNVSESMGIVHTCDAVFALITSEDLEEMGQLMIKQLKNRWGDIFKPSRFVVGIDRAKMRLINIDSEVSHTTKKQAKQTENDSIVDTNIPSVGKKGKIDKSKVAGMTF